MATDLQIIDALRKYVKEGKKTKMNTKYAYRDEYICANPGGEVSNAGCPEDDPYCNCPCKDLQPRKAKIYEKLDFINWFRSRFGTIVNLDSTTNYVVLEQEGLDDEWNYIQFETLSDAKTALLEFPIDPDPTDDELDDMVLDTKECLKIEDVLGEEYLGCLWDEPNSPSSCNCPCIGDKFHEYMEYTKSLATFWDTPPHTPLYGNAQAQLASSQIIQIGMVGNLNLRPGQIIRITIPPEEADPTIEEKNLSGKWMIQEITHEINDPTIYFMRLTLTRDSLLKRPEESEEITDWLKDIQ